MSDEPHHYPERECCACYGDKPATDARCKEKPELRVREPIGMYHCPECGAMVVAGFHHPPLCEDCQPKEAT